MTKLVTNHSAIAGLALYITDLSEGIACESMLEYRSWLSASEAARLNKIRTEQDRKRYIVSRALVRGVLSELVGIQPKELTIEIAERGKPVLGNFCDDNGRMLDFNLSHTDSLCVLAVNQHGGVGVDTERMDRLVDFMSIANRYFTEQEATGLLSVTGCRRQELFFELWTLKEAFSKKSGLGLAATSLGSVGFDFRSDSLVFSDSTRARKKNEHFYRLRYKNVYQVALAYDANEEKPLTCFLTLPGVSIVQLKADKTSGLLQVLT